MKKIMPLMAVFVMILTSMAGCGGVNTNINVISREEGSGTRNAFVELMGIKVEGVDNTTLAAEISSSTSVVMATVAGNKNAIGYISLGSVNDTVKAVNIEGVEATAENIHRGEYIAARPFNIVTGTKMSELTQDFTRFIMSKEGQAIIGEEGYIKAVEETESYYKHRNLSGRLVLAGSTSVAPVMDVLSDAYKTMYPEVEIEIQQTGSGAGIISTIEGACNIGMSSRDLKDEEEAKGVRQTRIALDGIAVIVNIDNNIENLTKEELRRIFTGEITGWDDLEST